MNISKNVSLLMVLKFLWLRGQGIDNKHVIKCSTCNIIL